LPGFDDEAFLLQLLCVLKAKRKKDGAPDVPGNFKPAGFFIVLFDQEHGVASAAANGYVNALQLTEASTKLILNPEFKLKKR